MEGTCTAQFIQKLLHLKLSKKRLWLVQHKPSYKEDSSCIELNAMVLSPNSPLSCVAIHSLTLN